MSSQGAYGRELDSRRSSVAPRGTTSASVDGSHDIGPRGAEDIAGPLGFCVSPFECKCDGKTNIGATVVFNTTATAPSTHSTTQLKL